MQHAVCVGWLNRELESSQDSSLLSLGSICEVKGHASESDNKYSVFIIDGTLPEVTGHDFEGILWAGTVMPQESGVSLLQKYILELQAS